MTDITSPTEAAAPAHEYVTGVNAFGVGNDIILAFNRPISSSIIDPKTGIPAVDIRQLVVANLLMSIATAKELMVVLHEVVHSYELEVGEIQTPFLKAKKSKV